ncbi:MAG: hypothetical protein WDM78_09100 [Puia sp.]
MGLEGMIEDLIRETEKTFKPENGIFWSSEKNWNGKLPLGEYKEIRRIARDITHAENSQRASDNRQPSSINHQSESVIGHRSSVIDERSAFNENRQPSTAHRQLPTANRKLPTIVGITGTGGAGKSSVTGRNCRAFPQWISGENNCCNFCGSVKEKKQAAHYWVIVSA